MVSCFPEDCFPEENLFMVCFFPKSNPINEKCDIRLIKDISNIILSYLYVCRSSPWMWMPSHSP
jgi:hypothetical protein